MVVQATRGRLPEADAVDQHSGIPNARPPPPGGGHQVPPVPGDNSRSPIAGQDDQSSRHRNSPGRPPGCASSSSSGTTSTVPAHNHCKCPATTDTTTDTAIQWCRNRTTDRHRSPSSSVICAGRTRRSPVDIPAFGPGHQPGGLGQPVSWADRPTRFPAGSASRPAADQLDPPGSAQALILRPASTRGEQPTPAHEPAGP